METTTLPQSKPIAKPKTQPKAKSKPKRKRKKNPNLQAFYANILKTAKAILDGRFEDYGVKIRWIMEGMSLLTDAEFETFIETLRNAHKRPKQST